LTGLIKKIKEEGDVTRTRGGGWSSALMTYAKLRRRNEERVFGW
jgi:hypothetical protein